MAEYILQNEIKTIENLEFFANQVVDVLLQVTQSPYHGFSVEFADTVYIYWRKYKKY